MHRLLDNTLRAIRQDLDLHLDATFVHRVCRDVGHRWRSRHLTPVTLIHWLLIQTLQGNTALHHLSLMAGRTFTASAICQARTRLPLAVLQAILKALVDSLAPVTDDEEGRWKGHRVFLTDGSAFSMPDTPELQKHFGQPGGQKAGCGFPVAKILALFHAKTGLLMAVFATPLRTHEMSQVERLHPMLTVGDVLVGDRGFCSYAHLAMLVSRGVHALFRVHQKQLVDFTPGRPHATAKDPKGQPRSRWVRAAGPWDQTVEWFRPAQPPCWLSPERFEELPESILVREVRYTVDRPGFRTRQITLVTTLLDAEKYSSEALAELYGSRWRVEQNLRDLKQTMKMDVLKCQTVDGVLKELTTYAIVYNLVHLVMGEAGRRQGVAAERISFVDAMRWLIEARAGDPLPSLVVNPVRLGRVEPRVRKRRPKQYPLMRKPRQELRESLITQSGTA